MAFCTRAQLTGVGLLVLATGIALHEYTTKSSPVPGTPNNLIVAQKDTPPPPADLSELAKQVTTISDTVEDIGDKEQTLQVANGDTMMMVLAKVGIKKDEATRAIEALKRVYDLRDLKVGQGITVKYRKNSSNKEDTNLLGLSFKASLENEVLLEPNDDGEFLAKKFQIALQKVQRRVDGTIGSSFYSAALKKGVPPTVIREAINALSYDINWQHDPSRGDPFTIVYDVYQDTNGNIVRADNLKYVDFAPGGGKKNIRRVYRFQPAKGTPGYYDANGVSVVKGLLQTPMDPSKMRLTSKFGRRAWHPCGYSRNHKGVDFAAPVGTPVRAAGDGIVVKASYWGHYGNYVMIKHTSDLSTAYAHLSTMKVKVGMRVRQNQEIGRVGRTGRTTGPHLHYETIRRGVHVNPQSIKFMPSATLGAKDLAAFRQVKLQIEKEVEHLGSSPSQMASAETTSKTS